MTLFLAQSANTVPAEWIGAIGGLMGTLLGGIATYAASQSNTRTREWKEMQDHLQAQLAAALKEQERLREERNNAFDRMRDEIGTLREELRDRTFRYQRMQLENAHLKHQMKQLQVMVQNSSPEIKQFIEQLFKDDNEP